MSVASSDHHQRITIASRGILLFSPSILRFNLINRAGIFANFCFFENRRFSCAQNEQRILVRLLGRDQSIQRRVDDSRSKGKRRKCADVGHRTVRPVGPGETMVGRRTDRIAVPTNDRIAGADQSVGQCRALFGVFRIDKTSSGPHRFGAQQESRDGFGGGRVGRLSVRRNVAASPDVVLRREVEIRRDQAIARYRQKYKVKKKKHFPGLTLFLYFPQKRCFAFPAFAWGTIDSSLIPLNRSFSK